MQLAANYMSQARGEMCCCPCGWPLQVAHVKLSHVAGFQILLRIDLGSWMSITHQYQDNIAADDALLLYWGTLARTMNLSLNCWFHFWYFCFQCDVRNGSIPVKVVHKLKAFRKLWWRCPEPKPSSSECRPNPKPSKSQWANGLLLHAQLLPTEV